MGGSGPHYSESLVGAWCPFMEVYSGNGLWGPANKYVAAILGLTSIGYNRVEGQSNFAIHTFDDGNWPRDFYNSVTPLLVIPVTHSSLPINQFDLWIHSTFCSFERSISTVCKRLNCS